MWIMEQPLTIVFVGAVIVVMLVGGVMQTGKYSLLYAAIAAMLLPLVA